MNNQYFPQSVPHPGETLAEKITEMKMGPKEFAVRTGKPEKTIIAVLNGNSSITVDMAVIFENVTKISANFWINHQKGYDEFIARKKRKQEFEKDKNWAKKFPLQEMIKLGWLTSNSTIEEKTLSLLSFFMLSSHTAWENYYCNQQLKVAFRISLAKTNAPYAISAWLRQGEILAEQFKMAQYSSKKFKLLLPKIQSLTSQTKEDAFATLQNLCAKVGVTVVLIPSLKKTAISGATRWIKNSPCILLSENLKRKEDFWFTFYHEVGHILLHGKKEIFLEKVAYSDWQVEKEEEADDFARKWM